MKATIFIEGAASGPDSKFLQIRLREGFHKLLAKCELPRLPALKAGGGRGQTYKAFKAAHKKSSSGDYVAMLIDSEDTMDNVDATWNHVQERDGWQKPVHATDEQILMMTTCMETWIVADRDSLREHYGASLQETALPALHHLESRDRHSIQDALFKATRECTNKYQKGKRSFEVLQKLVPATLCQHLPSFKRCVETLKKNLL